MISGSFRHFSRHSKNAAPAMAFDTVSCLRSPDTAIREKSTFATSPNAAPATRLQNAAAQSAAPATIKRHASIDALPRKTHTRPPHVKKRNKIMLFARKWTWSTSSGSHFVSAAQRWGLEPSLRTPPDGCGRGNNAERTRLQPPDLQR